MLPELLDPAALEDLCLDFSKSWTGTNQQQGNIHLNCCSKNYGRAEKNRTHEWRMICRTVQSTWDTTQLTDSSSRKQVHFHLSDKC